MGRKGIFVLNAVANRCELPEVQSNIDPVLARFEFKPGHRYSDYLPDVDSVAAWTVGSLVAGIVLVEAGFFVLLLKFWKLIAMGLFGAGGGVWKVWGRKKEGESI